MWTIRDKGQAIQKLIDSEKDLDQNIKDNLVKTFLSIIKFNTFPTEESPESEKIAFYHTLQCQIDHISDVHRLTLSKLYMGIVKLDAEEDKPWSWHGRKKESIIKYLEKELNNDET